MLKRIYAKAEEQSHKQTCTDSVISFDIEKMKDCPEFFIKVCAENVTQAKKSVDDFLLPKFRTGSDICPNFTGFPIATQSFAHSLLKRLILEARQKRSTLYIKGANEKVKDAVKFVNGYV